MFKSFFKTFLYVLFVFLVVAPIGFLYLSGVVASWFFIFFSPLYLIFGPSLLIQVISIFLSLLFSAAFIVTSSKPVFDWINKIVNKVEIYIESI